MVKIILNADDFGKSLERNRAIDDAFNQRLICSAGLIVTGKHLQQAVDFMKKGEYVEKTHLHVNLSTNLLHEDPGDIPLTEAMRNDSFFCKNGKFRLYGGLPLKFSSIFKWKLVYNEIVAQYNKFLEVTEGKGNGKHIDFHLWYNLTWPTSIALNKFTRKHKIESVRYIGLHQKSFRYKLFRILSWNPRVKQIPATNIDYYLTKHNTLSQEKIIELYCHPNYKEDGTFLDDSPSYLKHERQPMLKQIQMLREIGDVDWVSWEGAF